MQIIYHHHSFIEIVKDDYSILIDPFISWNDLCDISLEKICEKNIKLILITHWHMDHIWDAPEIAKKTGSKIVSTFEVIQYLMWEYPTLDFHSMHIGGNYEFEQVKIKFVNAVHWNGVGPKLIWWKAAWIVVEINNKKIYHAGDTALTYDMKLLEDMKIDVAFLPIWDNFTMWIDDATKAVEFIKPKLTIPMHYNTFPTIKQNPEIFKEKIISQWISNCIVLKPGEMIDL